MTAAPIDASSAPVVSNSPTHRMSVWDLLAILVLVVAASTRVMVIATGHATPQLPSQDEEAEVFRSLRIGAGEHRPPHALWGAFSAYTTAASLGIYYVGGRLTGRFAGTEDFVREYLVDPRAMVTTARLDAALAGIALALLVWRLTRRIAGDRAAFVAVSLVALHPGLYDFSTMAKGDVLAITLGVAALLVGARLPEGPTLRRALLSGLLLGLAIGTKYHMALFAPALAIPLWCSPSIARARLSMAVAGATIAAFVASNPHCVLSPGWWWLGENGALALFRPAGMDPRKLAAFASSSRWMGWSETAGGAIPALVLLAGLAAPVFVKSREVIALTVTAAVVIFAMAARSYSEPHHYFPGVPLLAVLVGCLVDATSRDSSRMLRLSLPLLVSAAGLFGLENVVDSCRYAALPDTRSLAKTWIEANIPEGAHLLVDWYYTPRLHRTREDIALEVEGAQPISPARLEMLRRQSALCLRPAYRQTVLVHRLSGRQRDSESTHFDLTAYRREGARFAVISDAWYGRFFGTAALPEDQVVRDFYLELRAHGRVEERFVPVTGVSVGPTIEVLRLPELPR